MGQQCGIRGLGWCGVEMTFLVMSDLVLVDLIIEEIVKIDEFLNVMVINLACPIFYSSSFPDDA